MSRCCSLTFVPLFDTIAGTRTCGQGGRRLKDQLGLAALIYSITPAIYPLHRSSQQAPRVGSAPPSMSARSCNIDPVTYFGPATHLAARASSSRRTERPCRRRVAANSGLGPGPSLSVLRSPVCDPTRVSEHGHTARWHSEGHRNAQIRSHGGERDVVCTGHAQVRIGSSTRKTGKT